MSFSGWLRKNSEHYLLVDAQKQMAAKYRLNPPTPPRGVRDRFWRQVFTPVYRVLPWSLRNRIIQSLPGSHRRRWPEPETPRRPAV